MPSAAAGRAALTALGLAAAAFGCSGTVEPPGRRPRRVEGIDLARCIGAADAGRRPDPRSCPAFLIEALRAARETCHQVGGRLVPSPAANVWAVDVDGDGTEELTFEHEGNVECEGAWSVYSCGSLGCPITLYQRDEAGGDSWRPIAAIWADTPESIELVPAASGGAHGDLRVGCAGAGPCDEQWYYTWAGGSYEPSHILVRGFRVDFAGSVHGLHALAADTDLLAEPAAGGGVLARYQAGTEVAIVGTADGAGYYYVSPCNACESGFVARSSVRLAAEGSGG